MKTIEYPKLADVLQECVQYAMNMKVNMEDPNGNKKNFQISDISITLLNYQDKTVTFKKGIAGEVIGLNQRAQMLIQIWIANKNKKVKMNFPYDELILDPEFLKIFFISIIDSNIRTAVNGFFISKVKDNKYSLISDEKPNVDLEALPDKQEFTEDGISKVEKFFRWLYIQPKVVGVSGGLNIQRKVWIVCNSNGTKILQSQDICSIAMEFTYLSNKKHLLEDGFSDYYKTFKEILEALDGIKVKIQKKLSKMEMKRIESGIYPILLKSSSVCTLFHEAIAGHMLSAKYILDGESTVFENKLGKKFANNGEMLSLNVISVYDRPLDEYMANYKYDMEGTAAQNICLLDKGVVRNYLTDRNTAVRLKQKSNGHFLSADFLVENADGENVGIDPEPRISNLFVESHTDITLEQIKEVIFEQSDWYLEVESRNGQVFVETGTFDMMADNVTRVYKDGRRESVSAGVLSSNLTDFLASIQIVSNQYGESKGFCGSQSGYVPTHERAPAMLLYGINFVTDPKPEKSLEIDLSRDKFIPESFKV